MQVPDISSSSSSGVEAKQASTRVLQTNRTSTSDFAFTIIGTATSIFNPIARSVNSAVSIVSESLPSLSNIFSCSLTAEQQAQAAEEQFTRYAEIRSQPKPASVVSLSSEECLKLQLKWFEAHHQTPEVQSMKEQQPSDWLIKKNSIFPTIEWQNYPDLVERYNETIEALDREYQNASQGFRNCYLKWQIRIRQELQITPEASLKKLWPTLSFEKAREQWAVDCQLDFQEHSCILLREHLHLLRGLYKNLLLIQNTHKPGVAHPHLTQKIKVVLKQAAYNYISIDSKNRLQLAQVATHLFKNWKEIVKTGDLLPPPKPQ